MMAAYGGMCTISNTVVPGAPGLGLPREPFLSVGGSGGGVGGGGVAAEGPAVSGKLAGAKIVSPSGGRAVGSGRAHVQTTLCEHCDSRAGTTNILHGCCVDTHACFGVVAVIALGGRAASAPAHEDKRSVSRKGNLEQLHLFGRALCIALHQAGCDGQNNVARKTWPHNKNLSQRARPRTSA